MNIWYLKVVDGSRNVPFRTSGAAGKARQDTYSTFEEVGAKLIAVPGYVWDDEPDISLYSRMDGMLGGIREGDIVIQIYPAGTNSPKHLQFMRNKIKSVGAYLVGYLHDSDMYRYNYEDYKLGLVNMNWQYLLLYKNFKNYDAMILPTEAEAIRFKKDIGYPGPIFIGGPTPYKTFFVPDATKKSNTVIFAGSLEKARYIDDMVDDAPELTFNIYGGASGEDGLDAFLKEHSNSVYKGKKDPEAMLAELEGSYGLIWDSLEYPNVVGGKGLYEQLNSPYKMSMYMAAEIPIITWSKAAFAQYILENNIGWVIDDLTQLEDLVLNITDEDYQSKIKSLETIGGLVRDGVQLKRAVLEALVSMNEKSSYKKSPVDFPAPELGIDQYIIDVSQREDESDISDELDKLPFVIQKRFKEDGNFEKTPAYMKAKAILEKYGKL